MSYEASTHWTLTALVFFGSLCGIVSLYPISKRTNVILLEETWENLFARSILGISGEKSDLNWERDYLLGIKRVRRLYCNVGIGFHLQILPDGKINGAHNENQYSELAPKFKALSYTLQEATNNDVIKHVAHIPAFCMIHCENRQVSQIKDR